MCAAKYIEIIMLLTGYDIRRKHFLYLNYYCFCNVLWVYPDFLLIFRWKYYTTDVLSCQQDKLVAATNAHRRDLTDKIYNLQPNGTSELE